MAVWFLHSARECLTFTLLSTAFTFLSLRMMFPTTLQERTRISCSSLYLQSLFMDSILPQNFTFEDKEEPKNKKNASENIESHLRTGQSWATYTCKMLIGCILLTTDAIALDETRKWEMTTECIPCGKSRVRKDKAAKDSKMGMLES